MANSDLYSRFAASFAAHGDRVFIEDGARNWTFRDIEILAGRLAARLIERGVAPGDRLLAGGQPVEGAVQRHHRHGVEHTHAGTPLPTIENKWPIHGPLGERSVLVRPIDRGPGLLSVCAGPTATITRRA